jgi:hypothetical protein
MTMFPGPVSKAITRSRRDGRQVCDAANVQRHAVGLLMPVEQAIHIGDERRARASGRDVARTKIRHHRDSRSLGDHRGLADL